MEYISSDTNVWIDFSVVNELELPFRLPYLRTKSAKKADGTYALISAMTAASTEREARGNEQEPEFIELDSVCDEELPF